MIDHVEAQTFHARRGKTSNRFRYGVDYVMLDFEEPSGSTLFSVDRFNLWHLSRRNHGGPRGDGRGAEWFREVLAERGFPLDGAQLCLLSQPSLLWFHFNPVSFWIAFLDGAPCAIVAEVNNTFGQRHSYFCANPGFRPIRPTDTITAEKLMHVSPFQEIAGRYRFNFAIDDDAVDIRIIYENGSEGVVATLQGPRRPVTSASLLRAAVRRPLGGARVLALIHWQALILYLKRAPFLKRQPEPRVAISECQIAPEQTNG